MEISPTGGSNGNAHFTTINGNVSIANCVVPLVHVTIPFLEFVMSRFGKTLLPYFSPQHTQVTHLI